MLFLGTNFMLEQNSHYKIYTSKQFKTPLEKIIQCFSREYIETSDKIWIYLAQLMMAEE
jgi:hypothetical protein